MNGGWNNFSGQQPQQQQYQPRGGGGGYQGRGRSDRGGRGGRGGGRSYDQNRHHTVSGTENSQREHSTYDLCKFFVKSGSCRNGDNCRYLHNLVVAFTIPAHKQPVKSVGILNMPDGPKILSGSTDGSVKVWNLATDTPTQDVSIPTTGPVEHIEIVGPTIGWSVDEPLSADLPDQFVGMVHLFNPTDMSTVPIKRSADCPYTHPFGEVRSFTITVIEGVTFFITAGGEGLIRTWRFDAAKGAFEQIMILEGHIRAVTCILLNDKLLWSGSVDTTIRVWDLAAGKCLGVLSAGAGGGGKGHTDAVSCLEYIPASSSSSSSGSSTGLGGLSPAVNSNNIGGGGLDTSYIASGGAEGAVKLWKSDGSFVASTMHSSMVTALKAFNDQLGGVPVLIIGLLDGNIVLRSCITLKILFVVDSGICFTKAIWSIASLGQSCFATGTDDGNVIVWRIQHALTDKL